MPDRLSRRAILRHGGALAGALGTASALGACTSVDDAGRGVTSEGARTEGATPSAGPSAAATEGDLAGAFAGEEVTLLVYSGLTEELYKAHFVPQFEARTGARVTIDAAWTEGIARLEAAPDDDPPFDLVLTDPTQGLPAITQGLFQQFDVDQVPNAAANFHPSLLRTTVYEQGYGIPFLSSAMTLAMNTDLVEEPLTSWGALFARAPERGIMLYALPYMSLYTFAEVLAEAEGMDPGQGRDLLEADLEAVLAFAAENGEKVQYWWPSTTDAVNALVGGEVAAGNIHGNGLLAPARDGAPVAGVIPPGTEAYVQLFFALPRNVRNTDLALAAMDHICSREFQRSLAESGEYACAIQDIAEEQAEADPLWAEAFPTTEAEFEALRYYPYDVYAEHADRIAEVWDTEVLR